MEVTKNCTQNNSLPYDHQSTNLSFWISSKVELIVSTAILRELLYSTVIILHTHAHKRQSTWARIFKHQIKAAVLFLTCRSIGAGRRSPRSPRSTRSGTQKWSAMPTVFAPVIKCSYTFHRHDATPYRGPEHDDGVHDISLISLPATPLALAAISLTTLSGRIIVPSKTWSVRQPCQPRSTLRGHAPSLIWEKMLPSISRTHTPPSSRRTPSPI